MASIEEVTVGDAVVPPTVPPPASVAVETGLEVVGTFAFGDSPELADALLAFVARGSKRASTGALADLLEDDDPFPAPGQRWGLLDGQGRLRFVTETVEVTEAALLEVTPAFAWDEGEHDRTRATWLADHREYFVRGGATEPDALRVVFERFRIVWPAPDGDVRLTDEVRELRPSERAEARRWWPELVVTDRDDSDRTWRAEELPGLVRDVDGDVTACALFVLRSGAIADVVAVAVLGEDGTWSASTLASEPALRAGLDAVARREGWERWTETLAPH